MSPAENEAKTQSSRWKVCSPSAGFPSELLFFERRCDVSHKNICTVELGGTWWNLVEHIVSVLASIPPLHVHEFTLNIFWLQNCRKLAALGFNCILSAPSSWLVNTLWSCSISHTRSQVSNFVGFFFYFLNTVSGDLLAMHVVRDQECLCVWRLLPFPVMIKKSDKRNVLKSVE